MMGTGHADQRQQKVETRLLDFKTRTPNPDRPLGTPILGTKMLWGVFMKQLL